jgi:hypothetical protein
MIKRGNTSGKGLWILFILVILLSGIHQDLRSQARPRHRLRSSNLILETRAYYGFTLDHHLEITPYKRHYPAFEITVMKATYGNTRWEYMYNYPYIGLSYWYSHFGRTGVLGSGHAIFPFIDFPILRSQQRKLFFRLGVGLGWITKPYRQYDNYENLAIGSHINGAVNLMFEYKQRIGSKMIVSFGLSWMHFSNGSIKTPNYGMNIPSVNMALAYRLTKENPYLRSKVIPELYKFEMAGRQSLVLDVNLGMGIKDMQSTLGVGNRYFIGTFFSNLLFPVSYKSMFGVGVDFSYDGSDVKILENNGITPESRINLVKIGLTAAYELSFSRMAIMLNLGSYISGLDKSDGYVYEKLALRYHFNEHLFGSLTLKAHYVRADFIAFGVGYKFNLHYYKKQK